MLPVFISPFSHKIFFPKTAAGWDRGVEAIVYYISPQIETRFA